MEIKCYWLWYPGDFEIYHALLQNFSRDERGMGWPAFWYQYDCHKNVYFRRSYDLKKPAKFTVYSYANGYVELNGKKFPFGKELCVEAGHLDIGIAVGLVSGLPAVYIEGNFVRSDTGWRVGGFDGREVEAAFSERYTHREQNPSVWEYDYKRFLPQSEQKLAGGMLYDFQRELTAAVQVQFQKDFQPVRLCYGESAEEAVDTENCYHTRLLSTPNDTAPVYAFRYIFIPDCELGDLELTAVHEYVDIPVKASFTCRDKKLVQIWNVAKETFRLCSGVFFIDGIKRDRWIWSGDAYQCYRINSYLFFDEEINKRTILALRGRDPVQGQINTILDYSLLWIISVYEHYQMSGDLNFMKMIYPEVLSMMDFLECQTDENGFIIGRPSDWIFIDWADFDREGPLCAEQMLLAVCYRTMGKLATVMEQADNGYEEKFSELLQKIDAYFWSSKKQGYIDSFTSRKEHLTRHASLFAIFFDLVDRERQELLYQTVLCNNAVAEITTPYFKFFELEALCKLGQKRQVLAQIKEYWGGILDQGAVTIWEEFDPRVSGKQKYAMYGDPYGKSLCHAWGASPVYLLGRYFMGVESTATAYKTFLVAPETDLLEVFECTVPVKGGSVDIQWDGAKLTVIASRNGGTLLWQGVRYELKADCARILSAI